MKPIELPPDVRRLILDELGAAGLVAKQADAWHFDVKDAALAGTVAELARLYGRHVVEITRFVHAHADRGVHEFADAFRLRKER